MHPEIKNYIDAAPAERQAELKWLHSAITKQFPKASEEIRHGMPHHILEGTVLIAYAARAKHCMVYFCENELSPELIERFGNLKSGKACIKFAANRTHNWDEVHALYGEAFAEIKQQRG